MDIYAEEVWVMTPDGTKFVYKASRTNAKRLVTAGMAQPIREPGDTRKPKKRVKIEQVALTPSYHPCRTRTGRKYCVEVQLESGHHAWQHKKIHHEDKHVFCTSVTDNLVPQPFKAIICSGEML